MPAVEEHLTNEDDYEINKELLNTIKIPRNINLLQGKLPKSQYDDDKLEERDDVGELGSNIEDKIHLNGLHTNSASSILEKAKPQENDYIQSSLPSTAANKDKDEVLREIRSRHGIEAPISEILSKKKRKNPKTTPMNLELVSDKTKNKYQMYRNLNSQSKKSDIEDINSRRNNYK